jgi:NitT/TauT family transport system ATP-binding protein
LQDVYIEGVGKTFFGKKEDTSFVALDDVNLDIKAGEFISLLGPSGCGKSTLLRCIGGLETPTSGVVTIGGKPVKRGFETMGVVFQSSNLLPWLSILDNVLYPVRVKSRALAKQYNERALELLEQVGLFGAEYTSRQHQSST